MKSTKSKIRWRYGILVGVFLALLSLYPQFYLALQRGENYNGATFYYDYDEPLYASYLQAVIDGRGRKNDFYSGSGAPQKNETYMTIQFIAPYLVALPAHILGATSEEAFLFVSVVCAFLTSLTLFWFIAGIAENSKFAAIAVLFILLFGTAAAGYGIMKETLGFGSSTFYLLFLRRYTPAVPFPFLFVLLGSVWFGLKSFSTKPKYIWAFIAGVCLALMIYSYFFLWTAMLAWLFVIALLSLIFDSENRKNQWLNFWLPVFIFLLIALLPYFFLLSNRTQTTEASAVIEQTHTLVFKRPSLILGSGIFFLTILLIKFGWLNLKNQVALFVISFSILPLFVFNQQVLTGYSIQPLHYNQYVLNYLVLLALILLVASIWKEKLLMFKPAYWILLRCCFVAGEWLKCITLLTTATGITYGEMKQ
jgi:hypothetical protein